LPNGGIFNYTNLHVYHYSNNNPVKYTDPDGKMPATIALGIIGALSSGAASIVTDLKKTGTVDWGKAGTAAAGGAVAGMMIGSVIDTFGVSGVAMSTLVATGAMSSVVGGGITDTLQGNPLEPGKMVTDAVYGAAGVMLGESIGKLGELATGAVNSSNMTYMQNADTKGMAPLSVTFKDTLNTMDTNARVVGTITESTKQVVDVAKDVYRNTNDN
jgi:hypothetical protein